MATSSEGATTSGTAPAVFISYRRDDRDVAGYVQALYGALEGIGQIGEIFFDLDSLQGGENFAARIDAAVARSALFVTVIGPDWATITDQQGRRRLFAPGDFVALEVGRALARNAATGRPRVIPLLVGDTGLPKPEELPPALRALTSLQALRLRAGPDWEADVRRLVSRIPGIDPTAAASPRLRDVRGPAPAPIVGPRPARGCLLPLLTLAALLVVAVVVLSVLTRRFPPDLAAITGSRSCTGLTLAGGGTTSASPFGGSDIRFDLVVSNDSDRTAGVPGVFDTSVQLVGGDTLTLFPVGSPERAEVAPGGSVTRSYDARHLSAVTSSARVRIANVTHGPGPFNRCHVSGTVPIA